MQYKLINEWNKNQNLIETIFYNRGFIDDYKDYIHITNKNLISPYFLSNIKEGVDMLKFHIENNHKIILIIDSDADGFTSSALLLNYLYQFYPYEVVNNITYYLHEGKQHGLNDLLYNFINADFDLVVIPDAGTNDINECNILKELNKDILILDHHEKENDNPAALIINNQISPLYSNKELSGVGIVYKFCKVYDELLKVDTVDNFLDLVAVGMGADMMSLASFETAYLIREGIKKINNPFLIELTNKLSFSINKNGGLCPYTIGMYIAPQINGMIRMGTQEEKELMFKAFLSYEADKDVLSDKKGHKPGEKEKLVVQAVRVCDRVKRLQKKKRDEAIEIIEKYILDNNLIENKVIIIKLKQDSNISKTLTGLVANQIMAKYKRPVLILNYDEKTNTWSGSARGYETKGLEDFKKFISDSNLSIFVAGHKNAFGVTFDDNNLEKFLDYCNEKLKNIDFSPYYLIDAIYDVNDTIFDLEIEDFKLLGDLVNIWGQGMSEPKILFKNIDITNNITMMAKGTVKITLPCGLNFIKFNMQEDEFNKLSTKYGKVTIDVIGKITLNDYMGVVTPQVIIEDYDIISKNDYWF